MRLTALPQTVLFDCDGVLVDSERPMHEELHLELQERGVSITLEECLSTFVGRSIESVISTAHEMGAVLPANWKSILYERVYARLRTGIDVVPGVHDFIQRLKLADIPFCVVSNGSERKMELMLSQHDLWDDFKDSCFSAQSIGVAKPDPGLIRFALRKMNTTARKAVIIEDSPIGVQSAINAGLPLLIFDPNNLNAIERTQEFDTFRTMPELSDHVFSFSGTSG